MKLPLMSIMSRMALSSGLGLVCSGGLLLLSATSSHAIPDCGGPNLPPICEPRPTAQPRPPQPAGTEFRIPGAVIQGLVNRINAVLVGTQLHLNNFGPKHGNSWHKANDSYIQLPSAFGGQTYRFDLPELRKDLDCGLLCPDLGDAKFYVQDWNLDRTQLAWQNSSFKLSLGFESNGREIKGFHTGAVSLGDDGMPDAQIDKAQLEVYLKPVAVNGRLTYQVLNTDFKANIEATGACKVLGFDICNFLFSYRDTITDQVEAQVKARLNAPTLRNQIAALVQATLNDLGLGSIAITQVTVEGDDVIIRYTQN